MCRWQNIKIDLKGIWYEHVDLSHLAKNNKKLQAVVNMMMMMMMMMIMMILTTKSQDTSS
jgi:hypothetical protein